MKTFFIALQKFLIVLRILWKVLLIVPACVSLLVLCIMTSLYHLDVHAGITIWKENI